MDLSRSFALNINEYLGLKLQGTNIYSCQFRQGQHRNKGGTAVHHLELIIIGINCINMYRVTETLVLYRQESDYDG
jgi:hypothetical protein